ncbi:hypothetical protein GKG47_09025 [Lactonifactor sp. BIOML-A3]|uniref:hypothetical protein n=1 Tax=unclassified Lactonifactor TaxID=2636670 RepID=UPI0012B125CB|nr:MULTISPECIES: hypothetical protein [unclassified Lactonifactor]MSA02180.1 hypothetical protein [Lactonifactor sp. BIOML-A5]MSA07965.1 hypothetical protein [Lactonifactor sp. BIOML-A4]MSA12581.1 hypothetical protein [Lactonifactor sp. BIOML-A3]MSA16718.1 hypothetical protein [Lactonifactor sp. BIOML-A2]MSA37583.1 hypothetical protein [Lactonifactor sp. BIOML-A1]
MIKNNIKYGISLLPENCLPYREGYRYGAYKQDLKTSESHITEFFKTKEDIQTFVNNNRQYGKE